MSQINQYANEALTIGNDDFFDLDVQTGLPAPNGPYRSEKLKYGTLVTQLATDLGAGNLGTVNLTQTDSDRYYDGINKRLTWQRMRKFFIEMPDYGDESPDNHGMRVQRDHGGAARSKNRLMTEFLSLALAGNKSFMRIFEEGRVDFRDGGIGVGDGTIPLSVTSGNSSNAGILALFSSEDKPVIVTDYLIPEEPTVFEPQNSAIFWFRSSSKGVLFPTMGTIQRDAIPTPEQGLMLFNTDVQKMQVNTATGWQDMN